MATIHPGTPVIAYCLLNGQGEVVAQRRSDEQFYAASTIKLAVMLAAAIELDAGRLGFEDLLACSHSFTSAVAGVPVFSMAPDDVDQQFPAEGTTASVAELLRMMITRSSNEATDVLVDHIGFDAVASALADSGAASSRMERLIGDTAATGAGLINLVTTGDLARTMHTVVTGRLTTRATTEFMRATLAAQLFPRIALELSPGMAWGSKSGNVTGIHHDVAFVGEPGTAGAHYLAVCTRAFDDEQGAEAIRAVAASLLRAGGGTE